MSRFIDAVVMEATGRRSPSRRIPNLTAGVSLFDAMLPPELHRFRLYVTYNSEISCQPERREHALQNFTEGLRREVYGDFISLLSRLERAVLEQDDGAALSTIRDLRAEVYG